jgi:ATP-binding cassette subfamily B protein
MSTPSTANEFAKRELLKTSAFRHFSPQALQQVVEQGRLVRGAIGQFLLPPERKVEGVWFIIEGRVRLLSASPPDKGLPETVELLGQSGFFGAASILAGRQVECASVSADVICFVLPEAAFHEWRKKDGAFAAIFEGHLSRAELHALLSAEFHRLAKDTSVLLSETLRMHPEARIVAGAGRAVAAPGETPPELYWVASEASRWGLPWTPDMGDIRRIGFPRIESDRVAYAPAGEGRDRAAEVAAAELEIERVVDRPKVYPERRVEGDAARKITACFEILAVQAEKRFPKDAILQVLTNELRRAEKPSLHICGSVASIAGFNARLVEIPSQQVALLEAPCMLVWKNDISVLLEASETELVVSSPTLGLERVSPVDFLKSAEEKIQVLLLQSQPELKGDKFSLKWFLPAVKKHRRALFEVFFASMFVQLFAVANPMLTQAIIDKVLVSGSYQTLHVLGLLFILVAVTGTLLTALRTYLFVDTTNRIDLSLGTRIIDHLYRVNIGYFHKRPVGEISSRISELENIRQFLTGTALTVGLDAIFSLFYIGIMLAYSVPLSIVALAEVPLLGLLTMVGSPVRRAQLRERSEHAARTQAHLVETITGIQTVKSQNLEHDSRNKWQERYIGFVRAGFRAVVTDTFLSSLGTLIGRGGDLALLWYGAVLVINNQLTLGQLIAFRILAGYVTGPLLRMSQSWQNFQQVSLSVERLSDLLNEPPEQTDDQSRTVPMPEIRGKVQFDAVTFSYDTTQKPQVKNASFEVPAGAFVGVIGKSGSGKSTMIKLLSRLHSPESGRIFVDDYDVGKVELYSYRRQISSVMQDSLLFNDTILANISVADPDAPPPDVIRAAQIAEAHDFIMSLPQGYNTRAGEQGRALSGGQRQRIAIARAILRKPRILIFDEATSALDIPTERDVCRNLMREFKGTTIFFSTHRIRSVQSADWIIVMDNGCVIESGTHDTLMAHQGFYATIFAQQQNES